MSCEASRCFCFLGNSVSLRTRYGVVSEKQGDTPYCRESNNCIDYTADNGGLTAEDPCYDVKTEKSDASPIKTADYRKRKCKLIKHIISSLKYYLYILELLFGCITAEAPQIKYSQTEP